IQYEFKLELDRNMAISSFQSAGVFAAAQPRPNPSPMATAHAAPPSLTGEEQARIKAAMAKLSAEDRPLAEAQTFCAIDQDSPLGSMGPIHKVMIKDQPVFVCCKGCVAEAKAHPDETMGQFKKLMDRMTKKK